ncbi:MAG: Hsp20/alpha crystallin family protein [Eubacterium sp.]|nr:Hsp20/alpha crystallin family protein [Eubacterium sp.]MDD7209144.1 Hsp20/alpha crystallin family protein [Lachnospiraceae bacterium]MDY5498297.1 Hsp20/alpha crystallin family protein [Anaerobutyricum sp.]
MMMPRIFGSSFVDDIFDDMFTDTANRGTTNCNLMRTDVKDEGDHYELEMEMPGIDKENIKAELKDGYLTITAQQNTKKDEKDGQGKYIRRERYYGSCQRSFYVGKGVKQEDMKAGFKDGILTIDFPKDNQPEVEENRYITIE